MKQISKPDNLEKSFKLQDVKYEYEYNNQVFQVKRVQFLTLLGLIALSLKIILCQHLLKKFLII